MSDVTPLRFPFKWINKSNIKIRNNQVKKNTAKRLLYVHTMIFLKTKYLYRNQNLEIVACEVLHLNNS